jgi:hypothetical protein
MEGRMTAQELQLWEQASKYEDEEEESRDWAEELSPVDARFLARHYLNFWAAWGVGDADHHALDQAVCISECLKTWFTSNGAIQESPLVQLAVTQAVLDTDFC